VAQLRNRALVQATVSTPDISKVVDSMPNSERAAVGEELDFPRMSIFTAPSHESMGGGSIKQAKLGNRARLLCTGKKTEELFTSQPALTAGPCRFRPPPPMARFFTLGDMAGGQLS
jgi:hypothetical protein